MDDLSGLTEKNANSPTVEKYGKGTVSNDDGQIIIDLARHSKLLFSRKRIHQNTWSQPTKTLTAITDYIIQKQKSNTLKIDVRAYRRTATFVSNEFLVRGSIALTHKNCKRNIYNSNKPR